VDKAFKLRGDKAVTLLEQMSSKIIAEIVIYPVSICSDGEKSNEEVGSNQEKRAAEFAAYANSSVRGWAAEATLQTSRFHDFCLSSSLFEFFWESSLNGLQEASNQVSGNTSFGYSVGDFIAVVQLAYKG